MARPAALPSEVRTMTSLLWPILSAPRTARLPRCLRHQGLEVRKVFNITANPLPVDEDPSNWTLSHGGTCNCPVCGNTVPQEIAAEDPGTGGDPVQATYALSNLPQLHSLQGAQWTLHLDFDGNLTPVWGSRTNVVTPAYDQDGDASTFSDGELASIYEIWARVAEDFAPFNVDVTTVDTGNLDNGRTLKVAIGGNWSDWYGASAGGVAYVDAFTNGAPNVVFVFPKALSNGNARYVAEAASHEAGHGFGLLHQSTYSGTTKTAEYSTGDANWAPLMGVGFYSAVTTWHYGQNSNGSTYWQDDLAILSKTANGFGYRADDYGNSLGTAGALAINGGTVNQTGLIGRNDDVDYFGFSAGAGQLSLTVNVAQVGANLDAILELYNSTGTLLASANPTNTLGATLSAALDAGQFYFVVRNDGVYGSLGQYTISGTVPAPPSDPGGGDADPPDDGGDGDPPGDDGGDDDPPEPPAPEILVRLGSTEIVDGTTVVDFGTIKSGKSVTKTFTVTNTGDADLNLGRLGTLPRGFKLVRNVGDTLLSAGESTTFSIKLYAKTRAVYSGEVTFTNSDSDEGPFNLLVHGACAKKASSTSLSPSTEQAVNEALAALADNPAPELMAGLDFDAPAPAVELGAPELSGDQRLAPPPVWDGVTTLAGASTAGTSLCEVRQRIESQLDSLGELLSAALDEFALA